MRREKLTPFTMLSHDLGMEGDDAVEFFENFGKKFAVDLRPLDRDWHLYFGQEGGGLKLALFVIVPTLLFTYLVRFIIPSVPVWLAASVGVAGWMGAVYCWQRFRGPRDPQISIQDLVDCANTRKWTKVLPMDARQKRGVWEIY